MSVCLFLNQEKICDIKSSTIGIHTQLSLSMSFMSLCNLEKIACQCSKFFLLHDLVVMVNDGREEIREHLKGTVNHCIARFFSFLNFSIGITGWQENRYTLIIFTFFLTHHEGRPLRRDNSQRKIHDT